MLTAYNASFIVFMLSRYLPLSLTIARILGTSLFRGSVRLIGSDSRFDDSERCNRSGKDQLSTLKAKCEFEL